MTWPEKVRTLPRTLDRFRATSVFFDIRYPTYLRASIDARKWTSWAALSALASIPEIIEYDLEDIGLLEEWQGSGELSEIRKNGVFAVLKELRNYEVHIEYQHRQSHQEINRDTVREPIDHDSFFFSPINWGQFQKLRNVRSGRSVVDQATLLEFNSYAQAYSVETIVNKTLEWLAYEIHRFITRHRTDGRA